jgi:YcaO-like protein with predicted kinase domain
VTAPVVLFDRPMRAGKRHLGGTHRAVSLTSTLARARRLYRRAGVTRVGELTGLDDLGVPVFAAIRPQSRSLSSQQGKGTSALAAEVSAAMEAVETWHAETARPTLRGRTVAELPGPACAVRALPRQRALPRAARLDWSRGWDLLAQRWCWVPFEAVHLDLVFAPGYRPIFDVSSNGLASGNHPLEAVLHGLCEVIERDAEAQWRQTGSQRRLILDTVDDPACQALITRLTGRGTRLAAWDLTSDVEVPVVAVALLEPPDQPAWRGLGVYQGFGAHPSPAIALARALTEAAQTRLTYIAGGRDDFFPADYAHASDPTVVARTWAELVLVDSEPVDFAALPDLATPTLHGDLHAVLDALRAAGVDQALAVDLSRPRTGLSVVRTLIPGRATALEYLG